MALPTSREDLIDYAFRALGRPVIEVEVSEQQADDCVDRAILFWQDFNSDGTERQLFKYQLTMTDITNRYITLPANIIGAVNIFDAGDIEGSQYIFNVRYQIALNDLYTLTSVSMVPYYMAYSHLQLLEQMLIGKKPIRYNKITNRLYLDMDWTGWQPGQFIIVDAYQVIDPTIFPTMFSDRMLDLLTIAYMKKQWGTNLGKFKEIPMLGGVMWNGDTIRMEAEKEIDDLEQKIISEYSLPPEPLYG